MEERGEPGNLNCKALRVAGSGWLWSGLASCWVLRCPALSFPRPLGLRRRGVAARPSAPWGHGAV